MGIVVEMTSRLGPSASRVIAVTSLMGGDGKTTFCANIGAALAARKADGDVVFVDTSPLCADGAGIATAANDVIVVLAPSWHTVHYAERVIEAAKSHGHMRIVINRWRPPDREACHRLLEVLPLELLGVIPEDERLRRGEMVILGPECPAGREYRRIADRLSAPAPRG